MARSFDLSVEYSATAEQVHAAFADESYWHERLAGSGADTATLDSLKSDDGDLEIVTTQVLRSDRLPGIVSQFHRGDLQIVRTEKWVPSQTAHPRAPWWARSRAHPSPCRATRGYSRESRVHDLI